MYRVKVYAFNKELLFDLKQDADEVAKIFETMDCVTVQDVVEVLEKKEDETSNQNMG